MKKTLILLSAISIFLLSCNINSINQTDINNSDYDNNTNNILTEDTNDSVDENEYSINIDDKEHSDDNQEVIDSNHDDCGIKDEALEDGYSNWMKKTLDVNELVVDIAMIGAHDAFSNEIDMDSDVDPYLKEDIFRGISGVFLKNLLVNESKTQSNDIDKLLQCGVRYFDIRLSYYEDKWYTKHNYVSSDFEDISEKMTAFLSKNNGEFLILDFQHIHGVSYTSQEDYLTFKNMLNEYGILKYTNVIEDLSSLTYGELTNDKTTSKVIIVAPFYYAENEVLNYSSNVRSKWANSDDYEYIIDFLETESIQASLDFKKIRVMQAVTTMQTDIEGITSRVTSGSLIERANIFNEYLINYEDFEQLLVNLPIVMIDNAGVNDNEFNDLLMKKIITYNTDKSINSDVN